jgi:hypothetical protein
MKKFLALLLIAGVAASGASAQTRAPAPPSATPPSGTPPPAPASPLDGTWRGTSDGGSCNAPLDYLLTIESGFVDGSAYDTTARGPVPNPNKSAPPPPGPGLWQIHGVAKVGAPFNLLSLASVKGPTHQRMQLTARGDGQSLVVSETSGCRRTARLSRS